MDDILSDNKWVLPVLGVAGVVATFMLGGKWWALGGLALCAGLLLAALMNTTQRLRRRLDTTEHELALASARTAASSLTTIDESTQHSIPSLLATADRVDISGRTALTLFTSYGALLSEIARRGGHVRIVVVDPHSTASKEIYGSATQAFDANFATLTVRKDAIEASIAGCRGRFEVRLTAVVPTYGMVMAENREGTSTAQIQLYFPYTKLGRDRPVLFIPAADEWFAVFRTEFETLWNNSRPWQPSDGVQPSTRRTAP